MPFPARKDVTYFDVRLFFKSVCTRASVCEKLPNEKLWRRTCRLFREAVELAWLMN